MGYFWQSGSKTVLGSAHVGEQFLFSMFPSILTFDFDLNLGSFLLFGALIGYFWDWGSKTVLGSTRVVEKLLFSIVSSILTFDIYLIFGSFFTFWSPNGLFSGSG